MKKVRFEMQLWEEQKELLKLAANHAGYSTLTAFMLKTGINEAKKVIRKHKELNQ